MRSSSPPPGLRAFVIRNDSPDHFVRAEARTIPHPVPVKYDSRSARPPSGFPRECPLCLRTLTRPPYCFREDGTPKITLRSPGQRTSYIHALQRRASFRTHKGRCKSLNRRIALSENRNRFSGRCAVATACFSRRATGRPRKPSVHDPLPRKAMGESMGEVERVWIIFYAR